MNESPEDDWFYDPDEPASPRHAGPPVEDDWLDGEGLRPGSARPFKLRALADGRVLVGAGVLVAALVGVLAAAGVFSSSASRKKAPTVTTTAATTTTAAARPAARAPAATLKPGDSGAQVKVLQRALARLGYPTGAIDGRYGPATEHAVAAFQRVHGLNADGVLGPRTLHVLARVRGR